MSLRMLAASAALLLATVGVAAAQNVSLAPAYGTANLTSGFSPDPYMINVQSGGTVDSRTLSPSCAGFIATAPDVRINYTAGRVLPLIISVASAADTTLVVNGPDGTWYCDDDSGTNGLNPMVRFNAPGTGQYDVWVGTYGGATLQPAVVHISELYTQ